RGPAGKNLLAAGGARRALGVVWTFDRHLSHVRIEDEPRDRARRVHRALERAVQLGARDIVRRQEGDANDVEYGLDRNLRRPLASTGGIRNFLVPVVQIDTLAVDGDLELFTLDAPK